MSYTVQQLATLAGVTPRTLRFYDKAGLLSPSGRGKNGYRQYEEPELVRLQQILFYRELDFPLQEIKRILAHPSFNAMESLNYQKGLLQLKKKRLEKILKTIDHTISAMKNNTQPTNEEMYGSLSTEQIESYKKEAKERWGNTEAYRQSQERTKNFTKEDWSTIKEDTDANLKALVALMKAGKSPEDAEVQAEIAKHRAGINRFYDCTDEIYLGLADMYLTDNRFGDVYRKYDPALPEFLVKGMRASCGR